MDKRTNFIQSSSDIRANVLRESMMEIIECATLILPVSQTHSFAVTLEECKKLKKDLGRSQAQVDEEKKRAENTMAALAITTSAQKNLEAKNKIFGDNNKLLESSIQAHDKEKTDLEKQLSVVTRALSEKEHELDEFH